MQEAFGQQAAQEDGGGVDRDPGQRTERHVPGVQHGHEGGAEHREPRRRGLAPFRVETQQGDVEGAMTAAGRGELLARVADVAGAPAPLRRERRIGAAAALDHFGGDFGHGAGVAG